MAAINFGNSIATANPGLSKFRFRDGQSLAGVTIRPQVAGDIISTAAFRNQFLPNLVAARPGYKIQIRTRDSVRGWTTLMLEGTLDDMQHDLDRRYADYYGAEAAEFDDTDITLMHLYLTPPPAGGCREGDQSNSCLWVAINLLRGSRKWTPISIAQENTSTPFVIHNDTSFREYLRQAVPSATHAGLEPGQPIAAIPAVLEAVDALLRQGKFMADGSRSWALELLDGGGKRLWASPFLAESAYHLRIVLADGHYSLASRTLGEGSAMAQESELAKEAKDPLRVMLSIKFLAARQLERGARPVRYVPSKKLPGVAGDQLDELLISEDDRELYPKRCKWARLIARGVPELNAYELTGSMTRYVWALMAEALGPRWRPVDALGLAESRFIAAAMGCSLTYHEKMAEPAALEHWDQNSSHHAAMTEKIKLPCSEPKWLVVPENYFDAHDFASMGIYRLQRGPLLKHLSDSSMPWRRLVRSVGSYRAQKLAGLPGSYWTHADINWALRCGFPRSALRLMADGQANAMVYDTRKGSGNRSVLSSEIFCELIHRVYRHRVAAKVGGNQEQAEFYKAILKRLSGQLASNNFARFDVGEENGFQIPCSSNELEEIDVEGDRASGRYRPAAEPLYKSGYARWLPYIQAKSRINVAQEVKKLPAGACKRLYTDGFHTLAGTCKLRESPDLGGWKLEGSGAGQVTGLAKPELK